MRKPVDAGPDWGGRKSGFWVPASGFRPRTAAILKKNKLLGLGRIRSDARLIFAAGHELMVGFSCGFGLGGCSWFATKAIRRDAELDGPEARATRHVFFAPGVEYTQKHVFRVPRFEFRICFIVHFYHVLLTWKNLR
jgi:hypothetical protein